MKPQTTEIERLVSSIRGSGELRTFFKALWSKRSFQQIFFARREILFPHVKQDGLDFSLSVLFVDAFPDDVAERRRIHQLVDTPLQLKAEKREVMTAAMGGQLERITEEAKALATFLLLRFVEQNPVLKDLLGQSSLPDYASVKKALSRVPLVLGNTFEEFRDIGNIWEGNPVGSQDRALLDLFRRVIKEIKTAARTGALSADEEKLDLVEMITSMTVDMPSQFLPLYFLGKERLDVLLDVQRVNRGEYREILAELYLQRLIDNLFTSFVCGRCHDDPLVITTTSRLGPDQMVLNCPKCYERMFVAGAYRVHPLLNEAILANDGLLGVAIAWFLKERHVRFKTGAFEGDRETDFQLVLNGANVLLECKMYKTGKDMEQAEMNLEKAIKQATKTASKIVADGGAVNEVWIVSNYDAAIYREAIERALRCREANANFNVHVFDPMSFARRVDGG